MEQNIFILSKAGSHRTHLTEFIKAWRKNWTIYVADNLPQAFQIVMLKQMHILMLDIILDTNKPGDTSGCFFASEIRQVKKYYKTPIILFSSVSLEFQRNLLETVGWYYLETPFSTEELKKILQKAYRGAFQRETAQYLIFRRQGIVYFISINQIIWIENVGKNVILHLRHHKREEIPYKTFEDILWELKGKGFFRCSRFAIVNQRFVENIDFSNRYIKMKNIHDPIEIGRTIGKDLRKHFTRPEVPERNPKKWDDNMSLS